MPDPTRQTAKTGILAQPEAETGPGTVVVAALYRFAPLPDFAERRHALAKLACTEGVRGTLLLAHEGVNGTIAGPRAGIDAVLSHLRAFPGFDVLDVKESYAHVMPFSRLKVRLKREIVTMGRDNIDPLKSVGTYVAPEDWNALIASEDVMLIDTRNTYEIDIGTFKGAVNPNTTTFRAFPDWAAENLKPQSNKKIAMFCTGGIRCEKATALLKEMGFPEVYHLQGGILKYLETVPENNSLWSGECFVFDQRVSVGHGLKPGPYHLCSICRKPFETNVPKDQVDDRGGGYANTPCPNCETTADPEQKARAAERQKQIDLAQARGDTHIKQVLKS